MQRAIETELRLRTGAAAPEPEIERRVLMYTPSIKDNAQAKQDKIDAFEDFLRETKSQLNRGSTPQPPPGFTEVLQ